MLKEPFAFEFVPAANGSATLVRLTGPLVLQNMFDLQTELAKDHPPLTIFDLAAVPYMDSAGMGVITNYYVSATRRGNKVVVAAACPRVLELFKLTRVDTIIPLADSVEAAQTMG